MAEKTAPVFKKVADLRPATHGHNLHVKVGPAAARGCGRGEAGAVQQRRRMLATAPGSMSERLAAARLVCMRAFTCSLPPASQVMEAKIVVDRPTRGPKGQPLKVAECIVGDETGCIVFTARNEQGEARTVHLPNRWI